MSLQVILEKTLDFSILSSKAELFVNSISWSQGEEKRQGARGVVETA